jgi:enoyl-CoA hydratase
MSHRISRHDDQGLCTLTLDRAEKLNALDTLAFEALESHLIDIARSRDSIGCVVLRGSGRGFCAGADLDALGSVPLSSTSKPPAFKPGVIERLALLPQPVIAAIHGVCFTGGLELALACDFILADDSARFADTHGKWGLVGQWGLSQRLPRRVGVAQSKRMMMTARTVEAAEAQAIGLVDILCPAGELDRVVADMAREILANSWHTNFAAKQLLRETDGMSLAEGLAHEHYRHPGFAPDYQQRIARFKRK